ncbi:MAG TPA: GntR family transcriptional regulator, partial [Pyrinomonadaceae bacterium]|nr:GntR family transcriptional regulator [Pyrinomonadaceae bacterium]
MYITIDERDKRPLYQQVVDEIKALIAAGELPEGSSLPPVRQVAADLGVNQNTIAFAYRELQKHGLVKIKHGSG